MRTLNCWWLLSLWALVRSAAAGLPPGLLDVTQPPYRADAGGSNDCTAALQQAVNDARDRGLVCFFPAGT